MSDVANARIKGEVVHKGNIVPVEVEMAEGFLGLNIVMVHIPSEYVHAHDLTHMIYFKSDLVESVRKYVKGEDI